MFNRKVLIMSEIEAQSHDLLMFQQHLERIFEDLENGVFITQDEIADLRYACGLPAQPKPNPVLKSIFSEFGNVFGGQKWKQPL